VADEEVDGARRTLVVVGAGEIAGGAQLCARLEKHVEVVAVAAGEPLDVCLARLALPRVVLLAFGAASKAALQCAAATGDALARLVLVAPCAVAAPDDAQSLAPLFAQIAAPVLVAFGSDDARSALGRHYRARIRRCHFVLVYGAGSDLAVERPDALEALVADFVRRGARFVAPDESLALQP
jgi:pimeloyl-ACP methyl ester carboxylesterase